MGPPRWQESGGGSFSLAAFLLADSRVDVVVALPSEAAPPGASTQSIATGRNHWVVVDVEPLIPPGGTRVTGWMMQFHWPLHIDPPVTWDTA